MDMSTYQIIKQLRDAVSLGVSVDEHLALIAANRLAELQDFRSHAVCNDCGSYDVVLRL